MAHHRFYEVLRISLIPLNRLQIDSWICFLTTQLLRLSFGLEYYE